MRVKKYDNETVRRRRRTLVAVAIAFAAVAIAFAFALCSPGAAEASIRCGSPPICPGGMSRMCVCDPSGRNCAWVCVD